MILQTYYTILGIKEDASAQEIETAYKNKVYEYNPAFECSEAQIEIMMSITDAYNILSDPSARNSYDFILSKINKLVEGKDCQKVYGKK